MSKNNLRIVIPKTVDGIIKLANLIYNKHLQDGKNSPLNTLSDYNWNDHGPTLQQTIEKHAEAEDLNRRAEQIYRERDQLISELEKLIKSSRDLLKGVFKKNPKKLGEWGFEVNDTPRPPKAE